ncbi:hypothetical protein Hanom_Chr05g00388611 [Helianthus anomalus]
MWTCSTEDACVCAVLFLHCNPLHRPNRHKRSSIIAYHRSASNDVGDIKLQHHKPSDGFFQAIRAPTGMFSLIILTLSVHYEQSLELLLIW